MEREVKGIRSHFEKFYARSARIMHGVHFFKPSGATLALNSGLCPQTVAIFEFHFAENFLTKWPRIGLHRGFEIT